jgi:hypothetical protein
MSTDPYRFRDKRYYTPESVTSTTPEAPVSDMSAPEDNTPHTSLKKPMLWSLAAAGGIAAVSMLWATMQKKERAHAV